MGTDMGTDTGMDGMDTGVAITGNEVITLELELDDVVFIVSGLRDLAELASERLAKAAPVGSELYWLEYRVLHDNLIMATHIENLYVNQLSAEK